MQVSKVGINLEMGAEGKDIVARAYRVSGKNDKGLALKRWQGSLSVEPSTPGRGLWV